MKFRYLARDCRFAILVFLCILLPPTIYGQIITTIAGNGYEGGSGNGGYATAAKLNSPFAIAVDKRDSLYVSDFGNYSIRRVNRQGVIRDHGVVGGSYGVAVDKQGNVFVAQGHFSIVQKISKNGFVSLVAGTGVSGNSGDGGAATSAQLGSPVGVAVDSNGNVYIADYLNSNVRKVDPSGIITTFAGNSTTGFSGDGGAASLAQFSGPYGVATDNFGNIYVSDQLNNRVRKVDANNIISTVAGNGSLGYSGDGGPAIDASLSEFACVAVDKDKNIYIADTYNQRIRKVSASGIISTFAGDGNAGYFGDGYPATMASLNLPTGVAVNSSGDLLIVDGGNNRVRKVSASVMSTPDNMMLQSSLAIFPNPSNGTFTIDLSSPHNDVAEITITNILGEIVKKLTASTNKTTDVQLQVPAGVYYLSAYVRGEGVSRKIVVE